MRQANINKLTSSKKQFFKYVDICNKNFRFLSPSIYLYKKVMDRQKSFNYQTSKLLNNEEYLKLLYVTLISWNMNMRGAKMTDFKIFKNSLRKFKKEFSVLDKKSLDKLSDKQFEEVLKLVEPLFSRLKIGRNKTRIVGVSKILHFLLPRLIPPMDRTYTMKFFYGQSKYFNNRVQELKLFKEVLGEFYKITKQLNLSQKDVDYVGWNVSIPKMIDNAIIGYISSAKRPL